MFAEANPHLRMFLRLLLLPYCYININWKDCTKSKLEVLKDLFYIFFVMKNYPDNYSPCRLWEKDRSLWVYYYGSSYNPYQRAKLRKSIQPKIYLPLFNNKLITDLLCKGINVPVPEIFGVIFPEQNYINKIETIFENRNVDHLIIKPVIGRAGKGLALVYKYSNKIIIDTQLNKTELKSFVLREQCLIQEFIQQHEEVSLYAPSSVNTIRAVTMYAKNDEAFILSASMRFGVKGTFVDNRSAGGVAVGINAENGSLKKTGHDKNGKLYKCHPDSGLAFDGFVIPFWKQVEELSLKIQVHSPYWRLLGIDIALTKNGPVIIEINPEPDLIGREQDTGPLLFSKKIFDEFKYNDLLYNKFQRNLHTSNEKRIYEK
jgi:glutathione synthase/RimK-type ligase-like ATP-grasp enzyme